MRTTNFKTSSGDDLGSVLIDKDYLLSIYPELPYGSKLYLWGGNDICNLGDNTSESRSTPRQEFTSSSNWKQVACGWSHTAAIKTNGTLWLWGSNFNGQLGNNDLFTRSTPVQLGTETSWRQVSCGRLFTAAIKNDGTLWTWGINGSGQLGDNTRASRSTPRQEITSSTNWKQVFAAQNFTLAIKTDGTLWAWGTNDAGQLGDNTLASRSTPRQEITSSTNWKQVSGSSVSALNRNTTAAIKTDGTLWVWGYNSRGQVGDNTNANRSTPRQEFTSSTNWKQVDCGNEHIAAIKNDGTLWAWGDNSRGQVGDNTNANRSTPRQEFTSSTNWKQVDCGYDITYATKTDGTLWAWGVNGAGQLGDNTLASRSTPRQEITSSTNWVQINTSAYPNSITRGFVGGIQAPGYVD